MWQSKPNSLARLIVGQGPVAARGQKNGQPFLSFSRDSTKERGPPLVEGAEVAVQIDGQVVHWLRGVPTVTPGDSFMFVVGDRARTDLYPTRLIKPILVL